MVTKASNNSKVTSSRSFRSYGAKSFKKICDYKHFVPNGTLEISFLTKTRISSLLPNEPS